MTAVSAPRSVAELGTDRPLPCGVVHKAAPEQVFVTDWMPGPGDDWCTIAGRLPLTHARFSDSAAPYHDLLLLAEAVRQAGLVVASEILAVDDDRQFLLRELEVVLDPLEHARRTRESCVMLISQDPSSQVKMRPGRSTAGGLMRARISLGGRSAGTCEVTGTWVPERFYASLRGGARPPASDAGPAAWNAPLERERRIGKRNPANSVLTPLRSAGASRSYAASLVVDTGDPTFFDHPLDHVPGLYMLEGIQQLAVAATCEQLGIDHSTVVVAGIRMQFARIAELGAEVTCAIALDEDCRGGRVSCSQDGRPCCEGTVRIERL